MFWQSLIQIWQSLIYILTITKSYGSFRLKKDNPKYYMTQPFFEKSKYGLQQQQQQQQQQQKGRLERRLVVATLLVV